LNIEQQGSSQQWRQILEAKQNKASHKQYKGKKYNQKKSWNKKPGTMAARGVLFLPRRKQRAHHQRLSRCEGNPGDDKK